MDTVSKGMIYIFNGDGKGKTSAGIGIVIRTLATGGRVKWISWYKCDDWVIGEKVLGEMLVKKYSNNLDMYWMGNGFYLINGDTTDLENGRKIKTAKVGKKGEKVVDHSSKQAHLSSARSALLLAKKILTKGETELLVLDEVLNAVNDGLLTEDEVFESLSLRGVTNIILTGRGSFSKLEDEADLVSTIVKSKHPYDLGKLAVRGLDY